MSFRSVDDCRDTNGQAANMVGLIPCHDAPTRPTRYVCTNKG